MTEMLGGQTVALLTRRARLLVLLPIAFTLSACAQGGMGKLVGLDGDQPGKPAPSANPEVAKQNELQKATQYWGMAFAKDPRNGKKAINYARNLKALGHKRRALAVLQQASIFNGNSTKLTSEYGRQALDLGQNALAAKLLAKAETPSRPDWRVLSARGTVLARQGRHKQAISYFQRASVLVPKKSSVLNNLAMAYILDGRPTEAEGLLRKAQTNASPKLKARIAQNLSLVLGLQGKYDEAQTVSAKQLGNMAANANVKSIRKLVKLKPQLSPREHAEQLIQTARAANAVTAETSAKKAVKTARKTRSRKSKVALRRTKIKPAKVHRQAAQAKVAQVDKGPYVLRPTTHSDY